MRRSKNQGLRIKSVLIFSIPIVILIALVFVAYGQLLQLYFATDEWWAFSYAIANNRLTDLLQAVGAYTPGANLFIDWLYHQFGVNARVWATLALTFHVLNTLLVYWLVWRLSENRLIAWVTAGLFTILPMGSQFLHQLSLMPTSGVATLFGLTAAVTYTYRRSLLAAGLWLVGLAFNPYIASFVLVIPLLEIGLINRKDWRRLGHLIPIVTAFLLYLWVQSEVSFKVSNLHVRPLGSEASLLDRLGTVSQKLYQGYAELLLNRTSTFEPADMVLVSTFIALISLVLIWLLWQRRQYRLARLALLGLLWVPASLVLFSTLNTVALDVTYPSRYLYLPTIGFGLLIGAVIIGLTPKITYKKVPLGPALLLGLFALAVIFYLPQTRRAVAAEVNIGQKRQKIMDQLVVAVPKSSLGRDALFCFTSNAGHYGVGPEEIPLPFVHNFGFNLGVVYRYDVPDLDDFFRDPAYFLAPSSSFYYFSRDKNDPDGIGPGIGFAKSPTDCQQVIARHSHLGIEDVRGFAYDGTTSTLTNITDAYRRYLAGDQKAKAALYPWR